MTRIAFLSLLLYCYPAQAQNSQAELDAKLAAKIEKTKDCSTSPKSCYIRYKGTEIEIVNPKRFQFPNIYVHSLGPGQYVLARGAHCIELFFEDETLRTLEWPLDVGILIHGSGAVWPSINQSLRSSCEAKQ